jgi:hypothetical protein
MLAAMTSPAIAEVEPMAASGDFRPVFIMGHHRSGTTILYKLLADTGLFNVTTVFHVLNRHRLLELHSTGREAQAREELSREFEAQGLRDREFDSIKITPDMPEEYAYALDPPEPAVLNPRNVEGFRGFCRAVTTTQDPSRPLLLKNPWDSPNFPYIMKALPAAVFVHLHRDPVDVVSSQIRATRSLLEKRNEYVAMVVEGYRRLHERPLKLALARLLSSPRLPLLVGRLSDRVARINDRVLRRGEEMAGRCHHLTYEELCVAPARTISAILEFLGRRDAPPRDYAALVQPRRATPPPDVEARRDRIRARNAAYCRRFGV